MGGDRLVISLGYAVYTSPSHPVFLKGSACSPNWAPRVSEAFAFGALIFVHMGEKIGKEAGSPNTGADRCGVFSSSGSRGSPAPGAGRVT